MARKFDKRKFEKDYPGWDVVLSRSGHYHLTHTPTGSRLVVGSTPSDKRYYLNLRAQVRRIEKNNQRSMEAKADLDV